MPRVATSVLYNKAKRRVGGDDNGGSSSSSSSSSAERRRSRRASRKAAREEERRKRSRRSESSGEKAGGGGRSDRLSSIREERIGELRREAEEEESASASEGSGGRPSRASRAFVDVVHAVDFLLGLALVIYGGMVRGVPAASAICISYGLLLSGGSLAGVARRLRPSSEKLLLVDAAAGGVAAAADVAAFVAMLVAWDPFVAFLDDHREGLKLSEGSAAAMRDSKALFAAAFAALAALEVGRCLVLRRTKDAAAKDVADREGGGEDDVRRRSRRTSSDGRPRGTCLDRLLKSLDLRRRKRVDDLVAFDDSSTSMESPLIFADVRPGAEEYVNAFLPGHERGVEESVEEEELRDPDERRTEEEEVDEERPD